MDVISGRTLETLAIVQIPVAKKIKFFSSKIAILTSMKDSSEHEISSFYLFGDQNAFQDLGAHFGSESSDPQNLRSEMLVLADHISHFSPLYLIKRRTRNRPTYNVQHLSKRSRLWYFFFACPAGGGPRLGVLGSEILQHRPVHQFLMVGTKARFFNKVLDQHSFYADQGLGSDF
jgi:hypothetical protein